jgi:hypothetical protein
MIESEEADREQLEAGHITPAQFAANQAMRERQAHEAAARVCYLYLDVTRDLRKSPTR